MRREQEDIIDPSKPALIVKYGATRRKFRPLERELTVLGRSPGCDIGLVSPEVAPVHCVIVRLSTGWRIRDCSGRATRVNGKAIQDEPLCNGDTIQIGTFSFEAQLPPGSAPFLPSPVNAEPSEEVQRQLERLQHSRRKLAETALSLRSRVRRLDGEHSAEQKELARQQQDLEGLEQRLRSTHQEQLAKKAELERRAAELDNYARHLRRIAEKSQQDQVEQARLLEDDRADYEADLTRLRVELEQQRRELNTWQQELAGRQAELEKTASLVMAELAQERDQLQEDRRQLEFDREQIANERRYLDQQREEVIQERAELDRLREESSPSETPVPVSSRDTTVEDSPVDRLESARKLLRQLSGRRRLPSPPASA